MTPEAPQFPPRPTRLAWMILAEAIREGDLVIDATAGNGHDTAFLAEAVGTTGRVVAFDIQRNAIVSARSNITAMGFAERVEFHQLSHARIGECVAPGTASAAMFNLGYLPGGDHSLATSAGETLAALDAAALALRPGGILTVVCYPGHPEGGLEAEEVGQHLSRWPDSGWRTARYAMLATRKPAPFLLISVKPATPKGPPSSPAE